MFVKPTYSLAITNSPDLRGRLFALPVSPSDTNQKIISQLEWFGHRGSDLSGLKRFAASSSIYDRLISNPDRTEIVTDPKEGLFTMLHPADQFDGLFKAAEKFLVSAPYDHPGVDPTRLFLMSGYYCSGYERFENMLVRAVQAHNITCSVAGSGRRFFGKAFVTKLPHLSIFAPDSHMATQINSLLFESKLLVPKMESEVTEPKSDFVQGFEQLYPAFNPA